MGRATLSSLRRRVILCRRCPRLVRWRTEVARVRVKRFAEEEYWGKPVPGFGDPAARLVLVGLAPAAHGGNRTGRMFTGDESGRWLFRALYRSGFASQAESLNAGDGLVLSDCYITAAVRCAPPQNRPRTSERKHCFPFLLEEFRLLGNARVVVGLGKVGFESALGGYRALERIRFRAMPHFGHHLVYDLDGLTFLACYHPSQQNTFTGKLTESMFGRVFADVRRVLGEGD